MERNKLSIGDELQFKLSDKVFSYRIAIQKLKENRSINNDINIKQNPITINNAARIISLS